ncbi:tetratricopeptide repeat protein [Nocardia sp. NPDC004711]
MPDYHARDHAQQVNVAGDNTGAITQTTVHQAPPRPVVTAALRRDVGTFIGRDLELERILAAAGPGRVVSIHTIDGMPGVGKTALAVRAAHELSDRFPDGRFVVDLHAHTPGRDPVDPMDVLATLLTDLGVDPGFLPATLAGRRDLWLDRSSGKRMLLVLDDARDHAQVEPLLPAEDGCLTVITSRRRLVALDGAVPLPLDVLDGGDAVDLFTTLAHRTDTDRAAVEEIVRLCGYLPLAIVLLAGRMAHHPSWTVTELAADFAAAQDRLAELEAGDRAVRVAFTMSYRALPPQRQQIFRHLGVHPGTDFDAYAVAALSDVPLASARRELDALHTDHLLIETTPGRFRLHDLLREYARTLAEVDPAHGRAMAFGRLADYYQRTALTAVRPHHETQPPPTSGPLPTAKPPLFTYASSTTWMRKERANLLACLLFAASNNQLHRAIDLTTALTGELRLHGGWQQVVALQQRSAVAAHTISDSCAEAFAVKDQGGVGFLADDYATAGTALQHVLHAHRDVDLATKSSALRALAQARYLAGDYWAAVDVLRQALSLCLSVGHRSGEAAVYNTLGWVLHLTGDYTSAIDTLERALRTNEEIGNRSGTAAALLSLGWVRFLSGDRSSVVELLERSRTTYRAAGRRSGEAFVASLLGWLHYLTGDWSLAADRCWSALALYRDLGNQAGEAFLLSNVAWLTHLRGDHCFAADAIQQALAIYRKLGNQSGEASALNNFGRIRIPTGDYPTAIAAIRQALAIYRKIGNRIGEGEALSNLGWAQRLTGDHTAAADSLQQALTIFRTIGYRTGEVETLNRLAAVLTESNDFPQAFATYNDALHLARRIDNLLEQARGLEGLARGRAQQGDRETALCELREAVAICRRLGAAETDSLAAYLSIMTVEVDTELGKNSPNTSPSPVDQHSG